MHQNDTPTAAQREPMPTGAAAEHCRKVCEHIEAAIAQAGGWLSFERYMELALYAPGLGYYSAGAHKLGADGDFTTAPESSSSVRRVCARFNAPRCSPDSTTPRSSK